MVHYRYIDKVGNIAVLWDAPLNGTSTIANVPMFQNIGYMCKDVVEVRLQLVRRACGKVRVALFSL